MSLAVSRIFVRFAQALALASLAALIAIPTQPAAAADFTIKVAIFPTDEIHHEWGRSFEERLEKATNGRIDVKLFPGHSLGGIAEMVDGVQVGTIEISMLPPGFFKGVDPRYQVTDVPGLFDDIAHISRALSCDEFRAPFMSMAEDKGMIGISIFDYGPTAYASVKPIRKLADFKGAKMRVLATDVERAIIKEFGGTGIPMGMGNVIPRPAARADRQRAQHHRCSRGAENLRRRQIHHAGRGYPHPRHGDDEQEVLRQAAARPAKGGD